MRKSLALILSIAMVFSMFSSLAFAADAVTAEEKYEALKTAGIFVGMEDGSAGLDQDMTRAQFARVAGLLLGLDVDAAVSVSKFQDVKANHWAAEEIHAIDAAGIMNGHGNMTFTPEADVTIEQVARVLVDALGLTVDADAEVEGASDWAQGYVKAAVAAGLISASADFQANATRELLVTSSYAAYQAIPGVNGTTFTAAATAAKKITVTFNGAVDTSKVVATLWNGTNQVNAKSTTFADDKKSVVLEFANNLPAAEYTVKVEGLTDTAQTAKVKVEAEKVTKIEFSSEKAALSRGNSKVITTGYNVTNQYGEKINNTTLSATAGKGTATPSSGTLTVTAATDFVLGEKVVLSLVHSGGTFATATVEVGSVAQVASVAITQLYNADKKELIAGTDTAFHLVLDLKDQYGSSVTSTTYLQDDIIVTVSNPTAATLVGYGSNTATYSNNLDIAGTKYVSLTVAPTARTAGTSTVMLISKSTGAKASFDIVVKEVVKVGTLTLSAPASAPASSTVNIPYTAVDQFGAVIKHPTNDMLTSSSQSAVATAGDKPTFVKDIVKDVTNLQVKLPATKGALIITIISGTQVAQLTIDVTDAKVASVISGIKDADTAILEGGTVALGTGNVVVKDQYGNDITPAWGTLVNQYRVAIETSAAAKVSTTNATLPTTLTGVDNGSSTISLKLQKNVAGTWTDVDNSSYSFTEKVVEKADITAYTAAIAGTVYQSNTTDYAKALKVTGTIADGSSVTVTNTTYNYVVDTLPTGVTYTDGKLAVNSSYTGLAGDKTEAKINVIVIIKTASGQDVKTVELVASDVAPAAATVAVNVRTGGIASKVDANIISVSKAGINALNGLTTLINDALETKDQYGVVIADSYSNYVSNFSATARNTVETVDAGDTFNVTSVSGGKTITLKVIVTE